MRNSLSKASVGRAASLFAAILLASLPVAGHALSLCVCADGAVSLDTECVPQDCCGESHEPPRDLAAENADTVPGCNEVPLLPDSDGIDRSAVPSNSRACSAERQIDAWTATVPFTASNHAPALAPSDSVPLPGHLQSMRSVVLRV